MEYLAILSAAAELSVFLVIWFETEAFVEYCQLFKIERIFKLDEYALVKTADYSYQDFLVEYHNNFFSRLITCPICVSTWVGLVLSIPLIGFGWIFALLACPIVIFFGLFFYFLIKMVMGKIP